MTDIIKPNSGLVFMKVGIHDGEEFQQILERKHQEIETAGVSFWGYGGGTCHPSNQVQPFSRSKIEEGAEMFLIMEEIKSHHAHTGKTAREFSVDGLNWKEMPNGIVVTGSRYALVLGELQEGDLDVDISHYHVGYGPSRGKFASDYIQGRVDKACISRSETTSPGEDTIKHISHIAKLTDPFAVFVR